ncbi:hypothetical protein KO465_00335 [Candidatus Micrarchaeota archaeon]|nr:hypothetical protein [Candidatus Micrarchaeota archaeon]
MVKKTKEKNNAAINAGLTTFGILVCSIVGLLLINIFIPFRRFNPVWFSVNYWMILVGLSSLVGIFSAYLLFIYIKDYFELKSKFTIGVILAVLSLMLFAITSNPILQHTFGVFGKSGTLFSIVPMFFALTALAVLTWVSSK